MTAFDRLQDKTFEPSKMTPIDWVIWNSRASLPRELLEQAIQQTEMVEERVRVIADLTQSPKEPDWVLDEIKSLCDEILHP